MKKDFGKLLSKTDNPAKLRGTFSKQSTLSIAALTSFGTGLVLIASGSWRNRGRKELPERQRQADERSYFDAAPRSISGSHSSYESYIADSGGWIRKRGAFLLGSAAILTGFYLLIKK